MPLGADVPFFVGGHNAFVEGIGEQLHPLPADALPLQDYAVVKPAPGVATATIFGSPQLARNTEAAIVMSFLADAGLKQKLSTGFGENDLQGPAQLSCPEIAEVAGWLESRFGNSRMSGSGSAVFARIAKNSGTTDSKAGAEVMLPMPPSWTGRLCRSLDHHPLVGWAD